jgi:hypothetical protein
MKSLKLFVSMNKPSKCSNLQFLNIWNEFKPIMMDTPILTQAGGNKKDQRQQSVPHNPAGNCYPKSRPAFSPNTIARCRAVIWESSRSL